MALCKDSYSIHGLRPEDNWVVQDITLRHFPEELLPDREYDSELGGIPLTEEECKVFMEYALAREEVLDHEKHVYVLDKTNDLGTITALGYVLG